MLSQGRGGGGGQPGGSERASQLIISYQPANSQPAN
jgi:hypothetical protein